MIVALIASRLQGMRMKQPVVEKGFSLVEIIITIVVISIALTAAIAGWGNLAKHSADVMWQTRVSYLGQAYLEEILSRRFDENTPFGGGDCATGCTTVGGFGSDTGENRATFDDVDDYHGEEDDLSTDAVGLFGSAIQSYRGYRVEVDVTCEDDVFFNVSEPGGSDPCRWVKQVLVTVTPPGNTGQAPVVFSGLKGSY